MITDEIDFEMHFFQTLFVIDTAFKFVSKTNVRFRTEFELNKIKS